MHRHCGHCIHDPEHFNRSDRTLDDLACHRHHLPGAGHLFLLLDPHQDENAGIQKRADPESDGNGKQHVLYDSQEKRIVEVKKKRRLYSVKSETDVFCLPEIV